MHKQPECKSESGNPVKAWQVASSQNRVFQTCCMDVSLRNNSVFTRITFNGTPPLCLGKSLFNNLLKVEVEKQICSRDIELLAASMRLYYLPRELSEVIMLASPLCRRYGSSRADLGHDVPAADETPTSPHRHLG